MVSTVDVDTVGSYTVTYTANDAAGNADTATRTVNVVASTDTTDPVVDDGEGSGDPFYWPYDDIALGILTDGKWAVAQAEPDSASFDAYIAADPELNALLDIYFEGDYEFISDFDLTAEQVTTIVEEFETISGVDIPTEHVQKVTSTEMFWLTAMQVLMVENTPGSYGFGLQGFGKEAGTSPSDFGYEDKWMTDLGMSLGDAIHVANKITEPFMPGFMSEVDFNQMDASIPSISTTLNKMLQIADGNDGDQNGDPNGDQIVSGPNGGQNGDPNGGQNGDPNGDGGSEWRTDGTVAVEEVVAIRIMTETV